jgi:pSer/pThr/pTyr-binding forkhead associated (FHA) protein
MYKLVISDDEGKNTVVPLVRDEITIGRKEGNTIRLTERNVSRKHARISRSNGAYIVEDLSSYNGIRLNGRRIDSQAELHSGDQLVIGDYVLALQQEETAQAMTAPAVQAPPLVTTRTSPEPVPLEIEDTALTNIMAPKAEPRPPARLVLIYPPPIGAEFALSSARLRIGRAEHLDICINHRSISREHAELVQQGDSYRVIDLASANGVRVNGDDVQNAIVSPGDVLELGQVRLKFIPEGEAYRAEDDPAAKIASTTGKTSGSKATVWLAGGIIAAALGYAIYVATGAGSSSPSEEDEATSTIDTATAAIDTEHSPRNVDPVTPPAHAAAAAPDNAEDAFNVALSACQSELASSEFAAAAAHAATALQVRPSDASANRCLQTATAGSDRSADLRTGPHEPRIRRCGWSPRRVQCVERRKRVSRAA